MYVDDVWNISSADTHPFPYPSIILSRRMRIIMAVLAGRYSCTLTTSSVRDHIGDGYRMGDRIPLDPQAAESVLPGHVVADRKMDAGAQRHLPAFVPMHFHDRLAVVPLADCIHPDTVVIKTDSYSDH